MHGRNSPPEQSRTGLGRIGAREPVTESLACFACPARKSDICGGLDDHEIGALAERSLRQTLKAGDTLIWDGDPARYAYVVTGGALRASKESSDGRRQILDFLFSGQFIGIPSDQTYHFSVDALSDAEVCRFERTALESLMSKFAKVEEGYRAGSARSLENAYDLAYSLGRRTAMERVAAFLLDLRNSACSRSSSGVIELPMTRADIADFLGLTLETVSRAFSRLKVLGVIRLPSAQEVDIADAERLKGLAGSDAI